MVHKECLQHREYRSVNLGVLADCIKVQLGHHLDHEHSQLRKRVVIVVLANRKVDVVPAHYIQVVLAEGAHIFIASHVGVGALTLGLQSVPHL